MINKPNEKTVWYLKGTSYKRNWIGDERFLPVPLSQYGLPRNISHICYVKETDFFYYVTKDDPQTIHGRYIGVYNNRNNIGICKANYDASLRLSIESVPNGDIVALDSTSKFIFAIVKERGRGKENYTYRFQKYYGPEGRNSAIVHDAIIDFKDYITNHDVDINLSVVERTANDRFRVYFSGEGLESPCYFNHTNDQAITITPIPIDFKKVFNSKPKFNKIYAYNHESMKGLHGNIPTKIIAVDVETNDIFTMIHHKESNLKITRLDLPKSHRDIIIEKAVCSISVDLGLPNTNEEINEKRDLLIVADNSKEKLFSIPLNDKPELFTIIGAGRKDIFEDYPKEFTLELKDKYIEISMNTSLSQYKIPKITELIPISDHGFIGGSKETNEWFVLTLPESWCIGTIVDEENKNYYNKKYPEKDS